jgi:hypothetical protein
MHLLAESFLCYLSDVDLYFLTSEKFHCQLTILSAHPYSAATCYSVASIFCLPYGNETRNGCSGGYGYAEQRNIRRSNFWECWVKLINFYDPSGTIIHRWSVS